MATDTAKPTAMATVAATSGQCGALRATSTIRIITGNSPPMV